MSEKLKTFIGSKEEFWLTASLRETKNKTLVAHVIEQCNGMKPVSFTNADILFQGFLTLRDRRFRDMFEKPGLPPPEMMHIFYHEVFKTWLFSDVAMEGLKAVPPGYEEAFLCLLDFLKPERIAFHERAISNCQKLKNDETSLTAVLAEHFFSQLTPDHSYFMDENVLKKPDKLLHVCPCGLDECKRRVNFGNTAIGSSVVWHGYPDIFIDQRVPVTVINDTKDNSKEDYSTVEDDTESDSSFEAPVSKKMKKGSDEEKSSTSGFDSSFEAPVAKKVKKGSDEAKPNTSGFDSSFEAPVAKKMKKGSDEAKPSTSGFDSSFEAPVAKKMKKGSDEAKPSSSGFDSSFEAPVAKKVKKGSGEAKPSSSGFDSSFEAPVAKKMKKGSDEEKSSTSGFDSSFEAPVAKKMKKGSDEEKSSTSGSVGICTEMKNSKSSDILFRMNIIDQIMAEAITNAFAQVNSNGLLKGLMIPSFGCSQDHILVFLYDPENDILLQTNVFKIFEVPGRMSISAIVQVWMFLNFVILLKPNLVNEYEFETSRFHDSVMGYLSHYKNASFGEKLGPSESSYIGEVVMPIMFSAFNHIEARKRASSS